MLLAPQEKLVLWAPRVSLENLEQKVLEDSQDQWSAKELDLFFICPNDPLTISDVTSTMSCLLDAALHDHHLLNMFLFQGEQGAPGPAGQKGPPGPIVR